MPTLHENFVYTLLTEFPSAWLTAESNLIHLKKHLHDTIKDRYGRDEDIEIRETAISSICSDMPVKSMELYNTIRLIRELTFEINEIEAGINEIMGEINSLMLTIPGINFRMEAIIIAWIGDLLRFDSQDKLLAHAGLSPSTYQSRKLDSSHSHMKNVVSDIFVSHYLTRRNLSVTGI